MVDIKKCPKCDNNTSYTNTVCPYCGYRFDAGPGAVQPPVERPDRCPACGNPVSAGRTFCPTCGNQFRKKRGYGSWLVLGGFIAAALLLAVFVFQIPGASPAVMGSAPASAVIAVPTVPPCTVGITGQRIPGGRIQLRLMALTCSKDDISELRVLINGNKEGTLPVQLGSLETFPGQKSPDQVTVIARFSSGYEKVVLDSRYA